MKKMSAKILQFLPFVFLFLAILLIVQIVISLKNEKTPTILGYGMFLVVSPSMEDVIMTGDLIFVNTKETEFIEGDIITFTRPDTGNEIITHRIEDIIDSPEGKLYTTKGVNNDESLDWEIEFEEEYIIGKYVGKSGFLGDIYRAVFTGRLNFLYAILILIFLMIAILEIANIVKEVSLHKQNLLLDEKQKLIDQELKRMHEDHHDSNEEN